MATIDLIFFDAGGGHRASANALKEVIEQQQRPSYAARILGALPETGLGDKEERLRKSLEAKAQKMIDDGVLELEGRAW